MATSTCRVLYIPELGIVYIYVQQDHTNFPFITHVDMDRASTLS